MSNGVLNGHGHLRKSPGRRTAPRRGCAGGPRVRRSAGQLTRTWRVLPDLLIAWTAIVVPVFGTWTPVQPSASGREPASTYQSFASSKTGTALVPPTF